VTYYWLAAALCLSVLFLVIAVVSPLCWASLRCLRTALYRLEPRETASLLFALRILPVVLGAVAALTLALPAFLEYEPRATGEGMSAKLGLLALAGSLALGAMAWRGARLLYLTAQVRRQWQTHAQPIRIDGFALPVHCVDGAGPLLSVTGVFRPKIFVGRDSVRLLSPQELSAALSHEMAHVRSFDNLKQFLLRITQPPKWLARFAGNDAGWIAAAEIAADDDALQGGASALDLSSALVKIGRLTPCRVEAVLASQLVPERSLSAVEMRVARLERWLEESPSPKKAYQPRPSRILLPVLAAAMIYAVCIGSALPWVHEALEMIVR
jgi:hypothetical protein